MPQSKEQAAWPTRADGTPMTLGEMTHEQRRERIRAACRNLQREIDSPAWKAAVQKILSGPLK